MTKQASYCKGFQATNRTKRIRIAIFAATMATGLLAAAISFDQGIPGPPSPQSQLVLPDTQHAIVFRQKGIYAAFPSLGRAPETGHLYISFAKKARRTHYESLDSRVQTMTSRDHGRTWHEAASVPARLIDARPNPAVLASDGSLIRIGQNWRVWMPPERLTEHKRKYRIETPGTYKPGWFAITSGGWVERSDDGGANWARTAIPELDTYVSCSSPWSTIHLKDGRLLRAFMVRSGPEDSGDVYAVFTQDGRVAEVSRVMGDPEEKLRFTEETLVHQTSSGVIWMLTRVDGGDDHLWQALSNNGGGTWRVRRTGIKGHPPSGLVALRDGRLILTYGYRHPPYGIRAALSTDEGLTWDTDNIIVLRGDGASEDLGYPISVQLEDATILTAYYLTDDENLTYIGSTRWRAPTPGANLQPRTP